MAAQGLAGLFENVPLRIVQRALGSASPDTGNVHGRALLAALIGWLPLVALVAARDLATGSALLFSAITDAGIYVRYLAAAPLLVIAESYCAPRLGLIVREFLRAGLVPDDQLARFDASVASTRRLLNARLSELVIVALAYLIVAAAVYEEGHELMPPWHGTASSFTPAGWWHVVVSLPLLLVLLLGWLWRLVLWTRLLWLLSRLDLGLVASHPDGAAGIGFVGQSLRAFAIVQLAIATVAAGRSANLLLAGNITLPTTNLYFNLGLLLSAAALFAAPPAVFCPMLTRTWQRESRRYGALALQVGAAFERKWLGSSGAEALDKPDFSATTDLYQIVANVRSIRFVPVSGRDLAVLVGACLLPFAPVALMALPVATILSGIQSLLI